MRQAILLTVFILGLCTFGAGRAGAVPAAPRHTLMVDGRPFRAAAEALFRPFGEEYRVSGEVDDVRVSFSLRNGTLEEGVRSLVCAARDRIPDLTAYQWKGYVLKRRWAANRFPSATTISGVEVPGLEERVSLTFSDLPLRQALREVASQCSLAYPPDIQHFGPKSLPRAIPPWIVVEAQVNDVPVSVQARDVTPDQAMWLIAGSAVQAGVPLAMIKDNDNFILTLRRVDASGRRSVAPDRTLAIELHRTPLRKALQQILATSGGMLRVEASVPELPITLHIPPAGREAAMRRVVAVAALQLPGLTFARGGDHFLIYRTDLVHPKPLP